MLLSGMSETGTPLVQSERGSSILVVRRDTFSEVRGELLLHKASWDLSKVPEARSHCQKGTDHFWVPHFTRRPCGSVLFEGTVFYVFKKRNRKENHSFRGGPQKNTHPYGPMTNRTPSKTLTDRFLAMALHPRTPQ